MADFKRQEEINKLISFIGNEKVNIVAGLRRSGKTYLLTKLFIEELIKQNLFKGDDFGVLRLDSTHKSIRSEKSLDTALEKLKEENKKVIIIDEVQLVDNFANSLKAFSKLNKDISVFVTGSNSYIYSKEIIDEFQGDAETLYLSPLTYKEIIKEIPDYSLDQYLLYGGFPLVVNSLDKEKEHEIFRIFNEIFLRDIENKLSKELKYLSLTNIREIIEIIASSATPVSPQSLTKRFIRKINKDELIEIEILKDIYKVLETLENSFLMKHMEISDINENVSLENIGLNKKYYFLDNGLRFINCKMPTKALGLCLENAVFIELNKKGIKPSGKLFIGERNNIDGEIDFSFSLNNEMYFIQVTHTINQNNYDREINSLKKIDNHLIHKQVIYLNDIFNIKDDNIEYLFGKMFFLS